MINKIREEYIVSRKFLPVSPGILAYMNEESPVDQAELGEKNENSITTYHEKDGVKSSLRLVSIELGLNRRAWNIRNIGRLVWVW